VCTLNVHWALLQKVTPEQRLLFLVHLHMARYYKLHRKQTINCSLDEAWDFFSSPLNLKKITPDYLGFEVTSDHADKMYPGQIITYIVRPVLGIPLRWMTEITQVKDKAFFIDEQRVGPYKLWHHQHHFKATGDTVEMEDIIHYRMPWWILGTIAHSLFVKKKLRSIFDYRTTVVNEMWPMKSEQ